ncbi:galectin-1-like [Lissotriton helveticus]
MEDQWNPTQVTDKLCLRPGKTLIIEGIVHCQTERFNISIGQDLNTIALVVDARFHFGAAINTIVLNSRYKGVWAEEARSYVFPFCLGQKMRVTIRYGMDQMLITLQDSVKLQFPNRLCLDAVNCLFVEGFDLHSYSVATSLTGGCPSQW